MLRKKTENILNKYGIKLSKKQDQSHLVDERILERIVDYADIDSSDIVLEIGPGLGNLTRFLVEFAGKVVAVEKDERLVRVLREELGEENLEIFQGDVLSFDLPDFDKVVANLPYSISSPVTFRLIEKDFDLGVLMYQKEFVDRMVAEPGSSDYSRLSVSLAYRSEIESLEEVSPDKFIPQPEVSSGIVRIRPIEPPFEVEDEEVFSRVVKGAFQHRRQKIRNSLFHSFNRIFPDMNISRDEKRDLIDESISEDLSNKRAGKVTPEEFGEISDSLLNEKKELVG